jgi:translation initiation factor 2 subunit 3
LTGKFTDTHSEELKRGITIKLGYADIIIRKNAAGYNTKDGEPVRYVSFIDAPGHEMLMATMLSGAAIIDAAILVVAANEGIKPQTREHFIALQAKHIKNIIIVQNKIDLVSREEALKSYNVIKEFVKGTIAENAPIIPVSAQQEINIDKILEELAKIEIPKRDLDGEPLFLIARSFDINHPGAVVKNMKGGVLGGVLKRGTLKIGDEIEIKPGILMKKANQQFYKTITTKILGMYKGSEKLEKAIPGVSISIETELDPTLTKSDSLSGAIVGLKDQLPEITTTTTIRTSLFNEVIGVATKQDVQPIKTNEMLMISINTTVSVGTVRKIKGNDVELILRIPIVDLKGENVGVARNINNHWRLIGFGEVI